MACAVDLAAFWGAWKGTAEEVEKRRRIRFLFRDPKLLLISSLKLEDCSVLRPHQGGAELRFTGLDRGHFNPCLLKGHYAEEDWFEEPRLQQQQL